MKLSGWVARCLGWSEAGTDTGGHGLAEYLALSRVPGFAGALDSRTALLAATLAAELSHCRWCIERAHHDWRKAGLPRQFLDRLRSYQDSDLFTDHERAALAFVEAAAAAPASAGTVEQVRAALSDQELAELTAIVAEHHCLETIDCNLPTT